MSGEVSYDVYVKVGVDQLGRDEFGEAVAHFVERDNAVALKRRLEARGESVRVEKAVVHGLSEAGRESWFSDYSRVMEYEPPWAQAAPAELRLSRELSGSPQSALERGSREESSRLGSQGAQESSEQLPDTADYPIRQRPWWRRVFGG